MSDSTGSPAIRRLNISADLERYSRWTRDEQTTAQRGLKRVLRSAATATGTPLDDWCLQQAGDAELAVLPPGIDEGHVMREFPRALRRELYEVNHGVSERKRLRLRVAMHVGITELADLGFVGAAPIAVGRLRDSRPVREAMTDNPHADFALVISEVLHEDHLGHQDHEFNVDNFRPIFIDVPDKGFQANAFLYVPPAPAASREATARDRPAPKEKSKKRRAPERVPGAGPMFIADRHQGNNVVVSDRGTYVGRDQNVTAPARDDGDE